MLRRLYFLFPDEPHAQCAVDDLISLDISERRIHAIAKNLELKTLPPTTLRQQHDTAFRIEWFLWVGNLVVFTLTTIAFVIALIGAAFIWAMIDVPKSHVAEIERFIHHKYPVAVVGGVSWSVEAFDL